MNIAELLKSILQDEQPFWAAQFEDWVRSSRRFRTFAETYRDKIHKKLRTAQNESGLLDLFFELETAYRLLEDQRFTVEYEKFGLLKSRAPDFTVAFRVNMPFNLEVTRLRTPQADSLAPDEIANIVARKVIDSVSDKLGQMGPDAVNVLLIISALALADEQLAALMHRLRLGAEQRHDIFFAQSGYKDAREFLHDFQGLSAIVCRSLDTNQTAYWANSLAKHPVPKELYNALQKTLFA